MLKEELLRIKRGTSNFIDDTFLMKRREKIFLHKFNRIPKINYLIVPQITATEKDVYFAERLLFAYQKAIGDFRNPENDLWSNISKYQAVFFALLKKNQPKELAQYLCNMNKEDATIGTVQGNHEFNRLIKSGRYRRFVAIMAKDKLVSLAEAFGILPIENPEQGYYGKNIHENAEDLYNKICSKIGFDIAPPN